MARFLVDEDLPRSLARALCSGGLDAIDVRDFGLRGMPDEDVLNFAIAERRAVITADVEFGNILRFPLGKHSGIVVTRFPVEIPVSQANLSVLLALVTFRDEDLIGNVVVVTPSRIRIRRAPKS